MVYGIGTDIIEIGRIEKALKSPRFIKKCFSEKELEFLKNKSAESFAGNFSAKEAVSKAFGTGFKGFYFIDIEILRNEKGMPFVSLSKEAKLVAESIGITNIFITISHCKEYAVAYCVCEC